MLGLAYRFDKVAGRRTSAAQPLVAFILARIIADEMHVVP